MTEKNNIRIQKRETIISIWLEMDHAVFPNVYNDRMGYGVTVYKKLGRETCSFFVSQILGFKFSKRGINHIDNVTVSKNGAV